MSRYNDAARAVREKRHADARALLDEVRVTASDTALVRKPAQMVEQLDRALRGKVKRDGAK